jgi:hypothetical protein
MSRPPENSLRLPIGYECHLSIDLEEDRVFNRWVRAVFLGVAVAAVAAALGLNLPLETAWSPWVSVPVTVLAVLFYFSAHEATHGLALRWRTGIRPSYAFAFPFLTTGSPAYLNRGSTAFVALAPSLAWGVLLLAAFLLAPADARLTLYLLLALNFAGSGGDYAEAALALRQPPEALIRDDGAEIGVFLPAGGHSPAEAQAADADRRPQ